MSELRYVVLANWLFFAIFCYIAVIFVVGCFWLFRAQPGPTLVDRRLLGGIIAIFGLNLVHSVIGIVFFIIRDGSRIISRSEPLFSPTKKHDIIFGLIFAISVLLVIILALVLFFFGNMLAVRFSRDSLCIFGTQISYFSIIGFEENKEKKTFSLEYVYKRKHDRIWKERIVFWSRFPVTKFIKKEAPNFFDAAINKTFFERKSAVSEMEKNSKMEKKEKSPAPAAATPKPKRVVRTRSKKTKSESEQ